MAKTKSRTRAASEAKAPKRRRFVAGLIEGQSMYRAALAAGYSKSMARNAGEKILPGARAEFREVLARKIPQAKLIRRIAEGLDAKETRLAQFQGEYTDQRYVVDWAERRRHVELAARLLGYLVEVVDDEEEPPMPPFNVHVHFVKTAKEKLGLSAGEEESSKGENYG